MVQDKSTRFTAKTLICVCSMMHDTVCLKRQRNKCGKTENVWDNHYDDHDNTYESSGWTSIVLHLYSSYLLAVQPQLWDPTKLIDNLPSPTNVKNKTKLDILREVLTRQFVHCVCVCVEIFSISCHKGSHLIVIQN